MRNLVNPFELSGKWYKANFHTHTTTSDGLVSPAGRVDQYRKAGYDVLAITDHRTTNDVGPLRRQGILVVSGIEYHPACPSSANLYHLVGLNVPHGLAFDRPKDANRCIAQVRAAGGETILAHPYWCGHGYADFRKLKHLVAVEVYNATCDRHGRPDSEHEWAAMLDRGVFIPAVGTDDAHLVDTEDLFESWTWLKMPSLTVANVLKCLRRGACYASCGPKVHDFRIADGKLRLRCSPAAKIQFVAGPVQGVRRRAEAGRSITAFSIDVPTWPYVRAVVTDHAGRKAWTNPIIL